MADLKKIIVQHSPQEIKIYEPTEVIFHCDPEVKINKPIEITAPADTGFVVIVRSQQRLTRKIMIIASAVALPIIAWIGYSIYSTTK